MKLRPLVLLPWLLAPACLGAGAAHETCEALSSTASTQFAAVVDQNLSCAVDDDCTLVNAGPDGECLTPCGVLSNKAGATAVSDAAISLCKPVAEQGCAMGVNCPIASPFACQAGTCAWYSVSVTPTSTNGTCTTFKLDYQPQTGISPAAHHDIAVAVSVSGGMVYADPSCTTPATTETTPTGALTGTLTLPAGAASVAFSVSTSSGSCALRVGSGLDGWDGGCTAP